MYTKEQISELLLAMIMFSSANDNQGLRAICPGICNFGEIKDHLLTVLDTIDPNSEKSVLTTMGKLRMVEVIKSSQMGSISEIFDKIPTLDEVNEDPKTEFKVIQVDWEVAETAMDRWMKDHGENAVLLEEVPSTDADFLITEELYNSRNEKASTVGVDKVLKLVKGHPELVSKLCNVPGITIGDIDAARQGVYCGFNLGLAIGEVIHGELLQKFNTSNDPEWPVWTAHMADGTRLGWMFEDECWMKEN